MEASKWLDIQLLISQEEMRELFDHLHSTVGKFQIFQIGKVTSLGEEEIYLEQFLELYERYILALKNGNYPDEQESRLIFTSIWTLTPDVVTKQLLPGERQLIKLIKPAIQLQPHTMFYSEHDGKFHSMVYGRDNILWGLQFSYPQLFLEPQTKEVLKVIEGPQFPNTTLFKQIQRWVRNHTFPTPMKTARENVNLPIRLGKKCLSWINQHPQLLKNNLTCS